MSWMVIRFLRDRSGSNALEYGLIVALVSLSVVGGAFLAGGQLGSMFNAIATQLQSVTSGI